MSIQIPLTAGIEQAKASVNSAAPTNSVQSKENTAFGPFTDDVVSISSQAQKAQSAESDIEQTKTQTDSISISSSIGRATSRGSLSHEQAVKLYSEIAAML